MAHKYYDGLKGSNCRSWRIWQWSSSKYLCRVRLRRDSGDAGMGVTTARATTVRS